MNNRIADDVYRGTSDRTLRLATCAGLTAGRSSRWIKVKNPSGTLVIINLERRLQFQNSTKRNAGLADQRSAFHLGLSIRIDAREATTDFPASKC